MALQHGKIMQEQEYVTLLTRQFSGELSSTEVHALQTWLDQSLENQRAASEWKQVWDQSANYTPTFKPDLDADFRKVQSRIHQLEAPQRRIVPIGRYLLRAAAMLIFLATAFWAFRMFVHPVVAQLSVSAETAPKREVILPDGSQVWLRQGSTLKYPQKFVGKERRVFLQGEAYFDVIHLSKQPFRVELPDHAAIEVLGTQFNICQNDTQNSVLVRSGRVRCYTDNEVGSVILNPGEKAVWDHFSAPGKVKVATFNELAWQTGGLEFIKTPLSVVVSDLEQYYKVKIVLHNPALRDCLHTAPLTNQPLEKVLQSLSLTYQFKVLHTIPGQYELVGGTCR